IRLLRLAVVLNHSREAHEVPVPQLILNNDQFQLALPEGWLDEHPLTRSDLEEEVRYQEKANLALEVKGLQSGDD
ncbi:MAG: exopolyphosphatase, partial [Oleibacter sp.]|nr:exopolyphosphatase [Thalassolituus sp.]